jgi:hypothetical protein
MAHDAAAHDAFHAWRRAHPNGFNMTEGSKGIFSIHWTQDKRENAEGRGCHHQGGSGNAYLEDKDGRYTAARKVCSDSLKELLAWAAEHATKTKSCAHCDTKRFSFPTP